MAEDKDILKEGRDGLKACIEEEDFERQKMLDDLRFSTLDQWPEEIRNEREGDLENGPRPCLTIDKINQYIVQVVNDIRQGRPGINVRPQDDKADVETAKILKGLIRNIEDQSNADIAYAAATESAARIGLGYIRITTDYVSEDSFDQDIFIRPIPNTFSTYLGKHINPDGSDAKEGFIIEQVPVERFKQLYPNKKFTPDDFAELDDATQYWHTGESITVAEYYCLKRVEDELLYLADGSTMMKSDYDKWPKDAGEPLPIQNRRPSYREQLYWTKMTGMEVLDKRELPGKFIPIVEVVGREAWVQGKRILWGLVRPAKDSLRMYNYWASTITEKMALAPKTPFVAVEGQLEGRENEWKTANRINRSVLQYKAVVDGAGNALPAPRRQEAMPIEAAMIQQLQLIEHDVQTSLGMFKAAVGQSESQQSGRAILALQRESDTGTFHFGANLGVAIRQVGRVILDMIPHYYDTKRIVRIIGEDGSISEAHIDPDQQTAYSSVGMKQVFNPSLGKYDVSITVGPSYNTKRMEAAATLTEVVKSQPQLMPLIGDLLFRSLDFPYSDQIAERMRKMLPPQLQPEGKADPAVLLAQAQQKMMLMGQQMQEMNQELTTLKSGAQAKLAAVQVDAEEAKQKQMLAAQEAEAELTLQKQKQDGELQLARDKAQAEIAIKQAIAEAEHAIKIKSMELENDHREKEANFNMKMKAQEAMPPEVAAQHYKNELMQTDVMPLLMTQLQQAFSQMGDSLSQMVTLQQQTLAAIQAPKSVSIGGVQTDASGNITGATVNTRIALNG